MVYEPFVRSHVERGLQEIFGTCDLTQDDDGDYPFRSDTSACFVRVAPDGGDVSVLAVAAYGLKPTAKVLREVNDMNTRLRTARVQINGGELQVISAMPAIACTQETLHMSIDTVTSVAHDIGVLSAAVFDGDVPFPAHEDEEVPSADDC